LSGKVDSFRDLIDHINRAEMVELAAAIRKRLARMPIGRARAALEQEAAEIEARFGALTGKAAMSRQAK
jgi:hypothetical protein